MFLVCDPIIQDVCEGNSGCRSGTTLSVNVNLSIYFAILVLYLLMVIGDMADFVKWCSSNPRWLYRKVYGLKSIGMHHAFYRLSHFSTVLVAAISSGLSFWEHITISSNRNCCGIAVWNFVWSVLYFIQLVPMVGFYVVSVQRMLKDLWSFGTWNQCCKNNRHTKYCKFKQTPHQIKIYITNAVHLILGVLCLKQWVQTGFHWTSAFTSDCYDVLRLMGLMESKLRQWYCLWSTQWLSEPMLNKHQWCPVHRIAVELKMLSNFDR